MTDVASIGVEVHTTNGDRATRQLDDFASATDRAEKGSKGATSAASMYSKELATLLRSIDRTLITLTALNRAQSGVTQQALKNAEAQIRQARAMDASADAAEQLAREQAAAAAATAKAGKSAQVAAVHFDTLFDMYDRDFHAHYVAGMNKVEEVNKKVDKTNKYVTQSALNLSRQFADVGVTAAMGMSPLLILVQQGPQIADALITAKTQGVSFGEAFKHIRGSVAPLIPLFVTIAAILGTLAAAFGLFERSIDKMTKRQTTWGDTFQATLNVIGRNIMSGPLGTGIRWLGKTWDMLLDAMVNGVTDAWDRITGFWGAAIEILIKHWRNFPQALQAIMIGAVNQTIQTVEGMINAVAHGINRFTSVFGIEAIKDVEIPRIKQANNEIAADFEKTLQRRIAASKEARERFGKDIAKEADKLAAAREKGKKGAAQEKKDLKEINEAAIAAAKAYQELTDEVFAFTDAMRGDLQDSGMTQFQKVQRDIMRGLSALKLWEQGLLTIRGIEARMNAEVLLEQAEAIQLVNVELENTPDKWNDATKGLQEFESEAERLAALFNEIKSTWDDIFDAIANRDWVSAFAGLQKALRDLSTAMKSGTATDKVTAVAAVGQAVGSAVGGRTGRVIGGAASGAALGFQVAGPWGALAGGILGGISGLLGKSEKAKRREAEAQKALERAAEIAAQRLEMEAELLGLQGKATESLAASRKRELESMDLSLRSLQEQIYQERDAAEMRQLNIDLMRALGREQEALTMSRNEELRAIVDVQKPIKQAIWAIEDLNDALAKLDAKAQQTADIQASILRAKGDEAGALAIERERELAAMDESLRPLQRQAWAFIDAQNAVQAAQKAFDDAVTEAERAAERARDDYQRAIDAAQDAVDKAKDNLRTALDAQRAVFEETIQNLSALKDALTEFDKELQFNTAMNNQGPIEQYRLLRREFDRLNALDVKDPDRRANLQEVGQAFLEASKEASATSSDYNADLQAVRRAIAATMTGIDQGISEAQAQIEALEAIAAAQGLTTESVLSVEEAVKALEAANKSYAEIQAAANQTLQDELKTQQDGIDLLGKALIAAQENARTTYEAVQLTLGEVLKQQEASRAEIMAALAAAQAAAEAALAAAKAQAASAPAVFDPNGYLAKNPDIGAEYARHTSNADRAYLASLGIYNVQGFAQWHWNTQGQSEGRTFASGGAFNQGIVHRPTMFNMGLMGEAGPEAIMPLTNINGVLGVRAANDNSELSGALHAMVDRLDQTYRLMQAMAASLGRIEVILDEYNRFGLYVRGEAPGEPVETQEAA